MKGEREEFVYVIVSQGVPLYQSLPVSNNWVVWLEEGTKLTLIKPDEAKTRIGQYAHYIEVSDEKGNEGYVRSATVSTKRLENEKHHIEEAKRQLPKTVSEKDTVREYKTQNAYVIPKDGAPIYRSLPSSNNWSVWLKRGDELKIIEPLESAMPRIGLFGHYIEVADNIGNKGYISAMAIGIKPPK